MTIFLDLRVASVSGAIRATPQPMACGPTGDVRFISETEFAKAVDGRDVLFGTHGYDNTRPEGICALARLDEHLALSENAVFVGILWPGDSYAWKFGYPSEKRTARDCGRKVAEFCNRKAGGAASLSFVSHSLGARLVLEAARTLRRRCRSLCLMAGAIERNCFEKEYADAFAKADIVSLLASEQDAVLKLAFPAGNLIAHFFDPTGNPFSDALGYSGLASPVGATVRPWQIARSLGYGHGDYLPSSDPKTPFPDTLEARWIRSAAFAKRTFTGERQTWPV